MGNRKRHQMNKDRIESHLDTVYAEQEKLLGHKTIRQILRELKKKIGSFLRHPIRSIKERNTAMKEEAMFALAAKDTGSMDMSQSIKERLENTPAIYLMAEKQETAYKVSKGKEEGTYNIHEYASRDNARFSSYDVSAEQMKSMFRDTPSREMTDTEFMAELTQRLNIGERTASIMKELESLPKPFVQSVTIGSLQAAYSKETERMLVRDLLTDDGYSLPDDREAIEGLAAAYLREHSPEVSYSIDMEAAREAASEMMKQGLEIQFPDGCSAKMRGDGFIDVMDANGRVLPPDLADDVIGEAVISGDIHETRSAPAEKAVEKASQEHDHTQETGMERTVY